MKKFYTEPKFEALTLLSSDVISTSFTYVEQGDNLGNDEIPF